MTSQADFAYGKFRQLTSSTQTVSGYEPARTVTYDWELGPSTGSGSGYRLSGITYPSGVGATVELDYGTAGGIDDKLSRVTGISVPLLLSSGPLASWRYMGVGRQVGMALGNGLSMNYDPPGSAGGGTVSGLDRWGRVLDVTYASGSPVLQFQYGYDPRGNRTFRRAYSSQLTAYGSEDSWLYGYDGLSRLVRASRGLLNAGGTGFAAGVTPQSTTWELDELGNWTDGTEGVSVRTFVDTDGDGQFDSSEAVLSTEHHDTNQINEIESLVTGDALGTNGPVAMEYDAAGNLTFDGERTYTYDAFNRVTDVHGLGRYHYDALGRRVATRTDVPGLMPEGSAEPFVIHVYGGGPEVLAEYAYDEGIPSGAARWFVHGQSFPDPILMVDLSLRGVQPAGTAEPFYYLKDALGSVTALTNASGNIVESYRFTPYGETTVLRADGSAVPVLEEMAGSFIFDADLDGQIEASDQAHLESCMAAGTLDPVCVFAPDIGGDGRVDFDDYVAFEIYYLDPPGDLPLEASFSRSFRAVTDVDGDARLDLYDVSGFQECATSNGVPAEALCLWVFDSDGDTDVDSSDWSALASVIGGPLEPRVPGANPSPLGTPFMWTGQRYDAATGMYGFSSRSYAPKLGRWLQRDPLGCLDSGGGNAHLGGLAPFPRVNLPVVTAFGEYRDGVTLYQYVRSSPAVLSDAFGKFSLVDISFSAGFSSDWESNNVDTGMSLLKAIRGLASIFSERNLILEELTEVSAREADLSGIDTALSIYKGYQAIQGARFAGSVLKAGATIAISGVTKLVRKAARGGFRTFTSFESLKAYLGHPGPGNVWHHIVEQSQEGRRGFEAEKIHSITNVVNAPWSVNHNLGRLYSQTRPDITGATNMTVREWLRTKSFDFNHAFGLQAMDNVTKGIWP